MTHNFETKQAVDNQGRRILRDVQEMNSPPGMEVTLLAVTLHKLDKLKIEWRLMKEGNQRQLIDDVIKAIGPRQFDNDPSRPGYSCVKCLFAYGATPGRSRIWLKEAMLELTQLKRQVEFYKCNPMPDEADPHSRFAR